MSLWLLFENVSSTCVPSILTCTWLLGCGMIMISECTKKKNDKPIVDTEANLKTCIGSVEAPPAKTNTETPVGTTPSHAAVVQTDQKTVNQKKEKALQSAKKKKCADASNKGKKIDEDDDAAGYENCSDMGSEQLRKIAETAPSCKKKS